MKIILVPLREIWPREIKSGAFAEDDETLDRIQTGLKNHRRMPPVVIWPRARSHEVVPALYEEDFPPPESKTKYILLNGHHRYFCVKKRRLKTIPCVVHRDIHVRLPPKLKVAYT